MKRRFAGSRFRVIGSLLVALFVAGCSGTGATTSAPSLPGGSLTIYAASSLTAAFRDLAAAYKAANGTDITLSFDASSALEAQIAQGAPADIFASADTTNPEKLVTANLAAGSPVKFAGNVLTIIAPATGSTAVKAPQDLAKAGVKIIGAGDAVPITKYASQLIANLAKEPGYPANFVSAVTSNIASKEDNVKSVVSKIELGEGDAGIVYVTDAKASTKVRTIAIPDAANVPATYAAVVVKASKHADASQAFLTWLAGSAGQAVLAKYGFLPPT